MLDGKRETPAAATPPMVAAVTTGTGRQGAVRSVERNEDAVLETGDLDIVVVGKASHHATHALEVGDLGLAAQALGDVGGGVTRQHAVIGGEFVGEPSALVEQGDLFGVVDRGVRRHGSLLRSAPGEGEHLLAQTSTSAVKTDFGCADRDAELRSDGFVRKVVDVAKHDHGPEPGRKLPDRLIELLAQVSSLGAHDRVAVGMSIDDSCVVDELFVAMTTASAQMRRGGVGNDAIQPGAEARIAPEAADAAVGPQIGVLHHVSCVFLVPGESNGKTERVAVGETNQLVERFAFAGGGSFDQHGHVLIRTFRPGSSRQVTCRIRDDLESAGLFGHALLGTNGFGW